MPRCLSRWLLFAGFPGRLTCLRWSARAGSEAAHFISDPICELRAQNRHLSRSVSTGIWLTSLRKGLGNKPLAGWQGRSRSKARREKPSGGPGDAGKTGRGAERAFLRRLPATTLGHWRSSSGPRGVGLRRFTGGRRPGGVGRSRFSRLPCLLMSPPIPRVLNRPLSEPNTTIFPSSASQGFCLSRLLINKGD